MENPFKQAEESEKEKVLELGTDIFVFIRGKKDLGSNIILSAMASAISALTVVFDVPEENLEKLFEYMKIGYHSIKASKARKEAQEKESGKGTNKE